MPIPKQTVLRHEGQYRAASACAHCEGIVRHEPWCLTQNADVRYAFQVAFASQSLDTSRPPDPARIRRRLEPE